MKRGIVERRLKQSSDDHRISEYRGKLKNWMAKLEIEMDSSIHDKLEAVIDEKVLKHDREVQAARRAKDIGKLQDLKAQTKNIVPGNEISYTPSATLSVDRNDSPRLTPTPSLNKPLPTITIQPDEGVAASRAPSTDSRPTEEEKAKAKARDEAQKAEEEARKKRLEEERLKAKKAEKERWRKSHEEFTRLPHSPFGEATRFTKPPSFQGARPSATEHPVIPPSAPTQPDHIRSTTPAHDEQRDRELAAQLQAQFAKEVAEEEEFRKSEDERKALEIAASLQRQWEAEDEKARPEKNRRPLSQDSSDDEDASDSDTSSSVDPLNPRISPRLSPYGIPRSPSPNVMHISPPSQSTSLSNIPMSGVSLGGGQVSVSNVNSGNTVNTRIVNSFNQSPRTYSIRDSSRERDE